MNLETLKTIGGYLITLVDRYTPFNLAGKSIEKIYNYLPINENLCTSGQPTEEQLVLIQQDEFEVIINLLPSDVENSLKDEQSSVAVLGMEYHHIPVDFKNPTRKDFARFVKVMNTYPMQKVWVHCAANMRVSAFVYLYRSQVLNESRDKAREDLNKIWRPFGTWRKFIEEMERKAKHKKQQHQATRKQ